MKRKQSMPNKDRLKALAAVEAHIRHLSNNTIYDVLANASMVATETTGMASHRCKIAEAQRKLIALLQKLRFELELWPST